MSKLYYLKQCDVLVGTIDYPSCIFTRDDNFKGNLPSQIRFKSDDGFHLDPSDVLEFLESRVVQENNQGLDIIMNELNYPHYDLEVLLDKTLGMTTDDNLWLVTEDNLDLDYQGYHLRCNPHLWIAWIDDKGQLHKPVGLKGKLTDE